MSDTDADADADADVGLGRNSSLQQQQTMTPPQLQYMPPQYQNMGPPRPMFQPPPPPPEPTSKMTRVLRGILIGVVIAGILIAYWWYWAMTTYKWSLSRLGSLMLSKYQVQHISELNEDVYFNYADVVLAPDKSHATCKIQKKNKVSQAVITSNDVSYKIVTDADPNPDCGPTDMTCIFV